MCWLYERVKLENKATMTNGTFGKMCFMTQFNFYFNTNIPGYLAVVLQNKSLVMIQVKYFTGKELI